MLDVTHAVLADQPLHLFAFAYLPPQPVRPDRHFPLMMVGQVGRNAIAAVRTLRWVADVACSSLILTPVFLFQHIHILLILHGWRINLIILLTPADSIWFSITSNITQRWTNQTERLHLRNESTLWSAPSRVVCLSNLTVQWYTLRFPVERTLRLRYGTCRIWKVKEG